MEGEIKQGYKKTPVGMIPEDWEMKKLISQAYVDKENINSDFEDEFINYVSLSDIKNGKILPKKIQFKSAPSRAKRITKKGDVLLATVRPNLKNFAIVDKENIIASTGFAVLGYKKMDLVYLYNFLYSHFAEKQYFALTVGSNYPALNSNDVKNLNLPIPPLPEQKAIADCLSTWDKGIEKLSALIASKKEQKKGLMQQLLTGKKRLDGFTEEWKETRLNETLVSYNNKVTKTDEYPVFTSAREGLFFQEEYYGSGRILTKDNIGFNILPENYITYRSRTDDGTFKFNVNNRSIEGSVSKYYPVFTTKTSNIFMLAYLNYFNKRLGAFAIGSSQRVLSFNTLINIKVKLSSKDEQVAISKVLIIADKEIELLEKKLEAFKTQKKGLMQVLLTGEKRLV